MAKGSDFDFGPRKIFFVFKMHGPTQGAGFKMHARDRRSKTFFATRSPAHFKGKAKLNKPNTQSCPVGSFKDSPPSNVGQLGPKEPKGGLKS